MIVKLSIPPKVKKFKTPLLIAVVGIVILGGYVIWSCYAWNDYNSTYRAWQVQVKQQFDEALVLSGKSQEEQQTKLQAFEQLTKTMATKDSICRASYFIAWQRIIPALADDENKCEVVKAHIYTLNEKLISVTAYLRNERMLGAILEPITKQASEQSEKSWESQAALWREIIAKVERLSVHTTFAPTKQAAHETAKQIEMVWQEVIVAHKAQDKSKYETSKTHLVQAYSGLGRISDISSKQIVDLYDALASAYKSI